MSNTTVIILCFIGIFASIVIGQKWRINMGIVAMAFAYLIGCCGMGLSVRELVLLWPTRVYFQIMVISLFFGFGVVNGTMQAVANHIVYACRDKTWMLTFVLFGLGIILGLIGCTPPTSATILAVMMFTVAIPAGLSPLLACFLMNSSTVGSFVAWGASGVIFNATITGNGYEQEAAGFTWSMFGFGVIITLILTVVLFVICKGGKLKPISFDKPEPFTAAQKKNLAVILIVVLAAALPAILGQFIHADWLTRLSQLADVQMLALLGYVVCAFLQLADERSVIKAMPWGTLLIIGGISTLLSIATQAGMVDIATEWLGASIPSWIVPAFLCLLGGFFSYFSAGITVVFPMLGAMVPGLAASTGLSPMLLYLGIALGASYTAVSPFSGGGALFLASCRDEDLAKKLVPWQLGIAAYGMIGAMIILSILNLFF